MKKNNLITIFLSLGVIFLLGVVFSFNDLKNEYLAAANEAIKQSVPIALTEPKLTVSSYVYNFNSTKTSLTDPSKVWVISISKSWNIDSGGVKSATFVMPHTGSWYDVTYDAKWNKELLWLPFQNGSEEQKVTRVNGVSTNSYITGSFKPGYEYNKYIWEHQMFGNYRLNGVKVEPEKFQTSATESLTTRMKLLFPSDTKKSYQVRLKADAQAHPGGTVSPNEEFVVTILDHDDLLINGQSSDKEHLFVINGNGGSSIDVVLSPKSIYTGNNLIFDVVIYDWKEIDSKKIPVVSTTSY